MAGYTSGYAHGEMSKATGGGKSAMKSAKPEMSYKKTSTPIKQKKKSINKGRSDGFDY